MRVELRSLGVGARPSRPSLPFTWSFFVPDFIFPLPSFYGFFYSMRVKCGDETILNRRERSVALIQTKEIQQISIETKD